MVTHRGPNPPRSRWSVLRYATGSAAPGRPLYSNARQRARSVGSDHTKPGEEVPLIGFRDRSAQPKSRFFEALIVALLVTPGLFCQPPLKAGNYEKLTRQLRELTFPGPDRPRLDDDTYLRKFEDIYFHLAGKKEKGLIAENVWMGLWERVGRQDTTFTRSDWWTCWACYEHIYVTSQTRTMPPEEQTAMESHVRTSQDQEVALLEQRYAERGKQLQRERDARMHRPGSTLVVPELYQAAWDWYEVELERLENWYVKELDRIREAGK